MTSVGPNENFRPKQKFKNTRNKLKPVKRKDGQNCKNNNLDQYEIINSLINTIISYPESNLDELINF